MPPKAAAGQQLEEYLNPISPTDTEPKPGQSMARKKEPMV